MKGIIDYYKIFILRSLALYLLATSVFLSKGLSQSIYKSNELVVDCTVKIPDSLWRIKQSDSIKEVHFLNIKEVRNLCRYKLIFEDPKSIVHVSFLNLYNLKYFPQWIFSFKNLEYLIVWNTNIKYLPAEIANFSNLYNLTLISPLSEGDSVINNFHDLVYLDLGCTKIKKLNLKPDSLKNLGYLKLSSNLKMDFTSVCDFIRSADSLNSVSLGWLTKIQSQTFLSSELAHLRKLELDDIHFTNINKLVQFIDRNKSLTYIKLEGRIPSKKRAYLHKHLPYFQFTIRDSWAKIRKQESFELKRLY